ncbi:hypothetical protein [Mycoplasma sp. 1232]|uniref:hypothetical protein n=1 Tax=Mycoplasma sp. 1232 TaxID=3108527 RepID=UPI002B25B313|nr:hypothetical protein [Mycoplasma sp. 1232]MEA4333475.1 hypothetical protein [Mycoplasma sp. 1232]
MPFTLIAISIIQVILGWFVIFEKSGLLFYKSLLKLTNAKIEQLKTWNKQNKVVNIKYLEGKDYLLKTIQNKVIIPAIVLFFIHVALYVVLFLELFLLPGNDRYNETYKTLFPIVVIPISYLQFFSLFIIPYFFVFKKRLNDEFKKAKKVKFSPNAEMFEGVELTEPQMSDINLFKFNDKNPRLIIWKPFVFYGKAELFSSIFPINIASRKMKNRADIEKLAYFLLNFDSIGDWLKSEDKQVYVKVYRALFETQNFL